MAHYAPNNDGHQAVNRAFLVVTPTLARNYSQSPTYEDNPAAHLKTEFGFDVLEVAEGQYASDAYRDFIGFQVATPLLDALPRRGMASPCHRFSETWIRPWARIATPCIPAHPQGGKDGLFFLVSAPRRESRRKSSLYNMSKASYRKNWGKNYKAPSTGRKNRRPFIIKLVPEVEQLQDAEFAIAHSLKPKPCSRSSFNIDARPISAPPERPATQSNSICVCRNNFDTGALAKPGAYFMADRAYRAPG